MTPRKKCWDRKQDLTIFIVFYGQYRIILYHTLASAISYNLFIEPFINWVKAAWHLVL